MKARPILFSAPMVRALLDDRKTQTRRSVKPQPDWSPEVGSTRRTDDVFWPIGSLGQQCGAPLVRCPYGAPGDLLWVRETHWQDATLLTGIGVLRAFFEGGHVQFQGGQSGHAPGHPDSHTAETFNLNGSLKKRSGRYMPRWASRLTLEITAVRVERLQEISEADADAECFAGGYPWQALPDLFPEPHDRWGELSIPECYARLWTDINGPDSWAANPFVWVVSFRVHRENVDQVLAGRAAP